MKPETIIKKLKTHTAKWTDDCQGKKDFDGHVLSISTRYWPAGGGFHMFDSAQPERGLHQVNDPKIKPSATASLMLRGADDEYVEIVSQDFKGETEAEVKTQVEKWASAQWRRAVRALAAEFDEK